MGTKTIMILGLEVPTVDLIEGEDISQVQDAKAEKTLNLKKPTFRFRRVEYFYDGIKDNLAHDFILENGKNKVIAGYSAPIDGKPPIVFGLHSTKGSIHDVSAVIGAMAIHCLNTYGRLPAVGNDLSKDSYRIVERLKAMGLVEIVETIQGSYRILRPVGYKKANEVIKTVVKATNEGEGTVIELSIDDYLDGKAKIRSIFTK